MINSIDGGKAFDIIQYPVMIKTLQKVDMRENTSIKAIYDKSTPCSVVKN